MMNYILDADWIIDTFSDKRAVRETLEKLAPKGIAVSIATVGEVYEGAFSFANSEQKLQAFRTFLAPFPKLPLNDAIMERFAHIRSDLRRQGKIISDFDILLAATALHYDLIVLTFNRKHFSRIPKLKIYKEK